MKYRVELDLSFDNEEDAITLLNVVEGIKTKAIEGNSDPNPAKQYGRKATKYQCYHDEDPPQPCRDYIDVDFATPLEKVHAIKVEPIDNK